MDLEGIMVSKISQTERNKYHMTSLKSASTDLKPQSRDKRGLHIGRGGKPVSSRGLSLAGFPWTQLHVIYYDEPMIPHSQ